MALHWGRPESPFPPYHRPDSGFGWTGAHGYGTVVAAGAPPSSSAPGSGSVSGSVSAFGGGSGGGGGGKRRVVRLDGSDEDDEPTIRPPVRRKRPRVTLDTYDPVRTGASPADQLDYPSDHSRSSSRNSNPGYVYLGPTSVPSYLANPNAYTHHADYNYSSYNAGASAHPKAGANVGANPSSAAATANNPYPSPGPNPTNPGPYHNPAATADWVRHGSSRSASDPDLIAALPAPTMERGLSNTSSSSGISSALSVSSSAAFSFRSSSSSNHHLYQQPQQQQQQHHHHHHQIPPPQHSHHLVPAATGPPVCFTDTLPSRVTTPSLAGQAGPLAGEVERTASGFSISSEEAAPDYDLEDQYDTNLVSDAQAGRDSRAFLDAFLRRNPDSQHERILRSLVESRGGDNELDFRAMFGIFTSANELFFGRCLTDRVKWDWSDGASAKYTEHVIGTTVVRRVPQGGGYETLIVLSRPILQEGGYSRRLAISTFLHELIHCFLFVRCGFRARLGGGHTPAFREIAGMVDDWIGPGLLYLADMSADLTRFLQCQDAANPGGDGRRRSTESSSASSAAASSSAHAPAEYYYNDPEYRHPYPYPYQSVREAQQQQQQAPPPPPPQSGQSPRLYRRAASHAGRHQRRLSEGPFRPPPLPPPPPPEQREYNEYERDYERHQRNGDERHQSSEYERGYDRHQNNEYEREYGRRQVNEYERDYERHQNNSSYELDHERDTAGKRSQDHHQRDYAAGYGRDHERGYPGNYESNRERDYPPQQQQQQQVQQHDFDPRHLFPHRDRESRPHNPHYHYDNNNNHHHHHHPSHHGQSHSLPPPLPRALSPDQQLQQYMSSARRSAGSRTMMRPVESRHGVWYDGVEDDCVCDVEGTDGRGAGGH